MGRAWVTSFDDEERIGALSGHWHFERPVQVFEDLKEAPSDLTSLRIDRDVKNAADFSRFVGLEQVHLINPTADQIKAVFRNRRIKRLLFGDAHRLSIEGIGNLRNLEELAFLNSSGPKDLGVLAELPKLRSLMLENLRGLNDWPSIGEAKNLRCLCLTGGFVEANTYVDTLDFLRRLPNLEHLYIAGIVFRGDDPAFEGLRCCTKLKTLAIIPGCFSLEDNAFLEAHFPSSARFFKRLYEVNGKENVSASNLTDAMALPAHEIWGQPEGRLSWVPLVQVQKGRSFTRIYTGPRQKVIERLKAFEECYAEALERALETKS